MAHHESKPKRGYRSPKIIHLGDAVCLTEGSAERKWDGAGATGWKESWPDADRRDVTEAQKDAAKTKPSVK